MALIRSHLANTPCTLIRYNAVYLLLLMQKVYIYGSIWYLFCTGKKVERAPGYEPLPVAAVPQVPHGHALHLQADQQQVHPPAPVPNTSSLDSSEDSTDLKQVQQSLPLNIKPGQHESQSDSCNEYQVLINSPDLNDSGSLMEGNPTKGSIGTQHTIQHGPDILLDVKLEPGKLLSWICIYSESL